MNYSFSDTSRDRQLRPRPALLLILVFGFVVGCGKPPTSQTPLPRVSVVQPTSREVTEWDEFMGRLEPIRMVEVRARVNGYLDSIHFTDGQQVKAGQLLFVIDPRPYAAASARARANVERARAALELATNDLTRALRLQKGHVIAAEEFDNWRNKHELAKAELARAEAEANAADLDLGFCQVIAPISGQVSRRFVDEGNLVDGGNTDGALLTTIVPFDPLYVTFDIDESTVLKYSRQTFDGKPGTSQDFGRPVRIALEDEPVFERKGILSFVDNRVDPETGTLRGRAIVENKNGSLKPGIFVRVQVRGREPHPALLLSDESIGKDQSRQFVMVVDDQGIVQRRFVDTGQLHNGQREITAGVAANDKVIVSGLLRVHPGDKVESTPANTTSTSLAAVESRQP